MWPDSEKTQELLLGAGNGNRDAVNQLMERHRTALTRMVRMRMDHALASRLDASDVVQDVLLEANQRLKAYIQKPDIPFHLWLRQLAKDRLIDMYRHHRVAQRRTVDREQPLVSPGMSDRSSLDLAAQLQDGELTPAAENIRRELAQRFRLALDALDESDKELILMRHWEQLTNSDVAQTLGLSQPAAGMRYLRAMRRLRDVLENEDHGNEPVDRGDHPRAQDAPG